MSETALDRVARALNLIPFIANNPGLSVVEIAARFNSSPTQISKDLSLLHMCGLPGYTHLELLDIDYEDPDYISVTEAQVLDQPRSLTQVEALTLVLGLQLLGELASDQGEALAIAALRNRISHLFGEQLARKVTVADAIVDSPIARKISESISLHQHLIIHYNSASSDSVSERKIFPLEIVYHDGIGYVNAFATGAGELRTFRLDRIDEISVGEADPDFVEAVVRQERDQKSSEIEIEMGRDGFFFMEKHNEIVTSFHEIGERFRITLSVTSGEWITRTLLAWPSQITIVRPAELAEAIRERIASALANYH